MIVCLLKIGRLMNSILESTRRVINALHQQTTSFKNEILRDCRETKTKLPTRRRRQWTLYEVWNIDDH